MDVMYGEWHVPSFLKRLISTDVAMRMMKISQAAAPAHIFSYNIPNRFQHCMGVAYLAQKVLLKNCMLEGYKMKIPIAALLHDAGNPPFTHLSEPFLKELTGKDGESFLENILDGSEAETVLKSLGIVSKDILDLITGKNKPIAEVLNGSLDLDNLDNISRFNKIASVDAERFDAAGIAASFRFLNNKWVLLAESRKEVEKWHRARAAAYKAVYSFRNLNPTIMLYRAVEIAFCENDIRRAFFFLDDFAALDYLANKCNVYTSRLIERMLRWDWYEEFISVESENPSDKFEKMSTYWYHRKALADGIAKKFGLGPDGVCVFLSKGRDRRKVLLSFVAKDGEVFPDITDWPPIYRLKVYAAPHLDFSRKKRIAEFVYDYIQFDPRANVT